MLNKYCFLGINYWLKDKLLTQTEVGENWVQYWLGAYTEVNIVKVLFQFIKMTSLGAAQRGFARKLDVASHEHQVSCDWSTTELVSDWSISHEHQRGVV